MEFGHKGTSAAIAKELKNVEYDGLELQWWTKLNEALKKWLNAVGPLDSGKRNEAGGE